MVECDLCKEYFNSTCVKLPDDIILCNELRVDLPKVYHGLIQHMLLDVI